MKLDTFIAFSTLSLEDQAFIKQYASPDNESSVLKLVPLSERSRAMNIVRKFGLTPRTIYRGPRKGWFASWAPKKTATSLAVYLR
jgi:hypothetical protein